MYKHLVIIAMAGVSCRYHDPNMLKVSPEQRLIMRNIPFFVLPPHESTPRTAHIGPRVDTHNTRWLYLYSVYVIQ